MINPTAEHKKHFFNRAGFGQSITLFKDSSAFNVKHLLQESREYALLQNSRNAEATALADDEKELDLVTLNIAWGEQLTKPERMLREKLTLFWHNHFACRLMTPLLAQQQNNTLRKNATGKFGDLLHAMAKDPGMLQYLNNQQNKKSSPNENFARELLELFTLGIGTYSESDIKNAARAFTGWTYNYKTLKHEFEWRQHDFGPKTFRGKTGKFTGEDILDMVLSDKQTARFLTAKVWKAFVSDEETDPVIIEHLAQRFYHSHYNIRKLLSDIYTSTWFYEKNLVGNKIKSPIELLAGIVMHTQGKFSNPFSWVFVQRVLGQVLFLPPNVGGWPFGRGWIDSSSLTFRMSLAQTMLQNIKVDLEAKDDGDVNNKTNNVAKAHKLEYVVPWKLISNTFTKSSADSTLAGVEQYLLAQPTSVSNRRWVRARTQKSSGDIEFIQQAFIGFMSLPEYQLC